jgi:hypothetical protein
MNTGIPRVTKSAGAARAIRVAAITALNLTDWGGLLYTFTRVTALFAHPTLVTRSGSSDSDLANARRLYAE